MSNGWLLQVKQAQLLHTGIFCWNLTRVKVVCDTGMYRGSKVLTSLRNERDSIVQIG